MLKASSWTKKNFSFHLTAKDAELMSKSLRSFIPCLPTGRFAVKTLILDNLRLVKIFFGEHFFQKEV
jgi:hypothetical protein